MSSAGFWAGDAIAQSIERIGEQARAEATLKQQQSYHCGDAAIKNSALAALAALDPEHPLLNPAVREEIWEQGKNTFRRHGWDAARALRIDSKALHQRLEKEFEVARAEALKKAEKEPIKADTKGFFTTRKVWIFEYQEYPSEAQAQAAKAAEIVRIKTAQLGDTLEFSVMQKKERARAREAAAQKKKEVVAAAAAVPVQRERHRLERLFDL